MLGYLNNPESIIDPLLLQWFLHFTWTCFLSPLLYYRPHTNDLTSTTRAVTVCSVCSHSLVPNSLDDFICPAPQFLQGSFSVSHTLLLSVCLCI